MMIGCESASPIVSSSSDAFILMPLSDTSWVVTPEGWGFGVTRFASAAFKCLRAFAVFPRWKRVCILKTGHNDRQADRQTGRQAGRQKTGDRHERVGLIGHLYAGRGQELLWD